MSDTNSRHSVLLIDMGGPEDLSQVKGYLQRIFSDPNIIYGNPIKRWVLSRMIANAAAAETRERYAEIGGKSYAVDNARILGDQLTEHFKKKGIELEFEVGTRYSFPDIPEGIEALCQKGDGSISAVYLYPHETSALTGSCEDVLQAAAKKMSVSIDYQVKHLGKTNAYIKGWAKGIQEAVNNPEKTFVMLTAHSLPMTIIDRGDQYISQVEASAGLVTEQLGDLSVELAYQSQEGKNWLGPTVEEKARSAREKGFTELVIAPLSFVGDNTETLLDIDKDLFEAIESLEFERIVRIPPPDQQGFLCDMVAESLSQEWGLESG